MRKNFARVTRYTVAATLVAAAMPAFMAGCEEVQEVPLLVCCNEFQVGGSISIEGESGVAAQTVADFAAIASASIDDLTAACRTLSEDLDAPKADRNAAEQHRDKRARVMAHCTLAASAIRELRAQAGGSVVVDFAPPVCEVSVSAKADCQARCSGNASCDVVANPPTCEGGKLQISCKGGCTGESGASVSCEGPCSGDCSGSCTTQTGVECAGECEGICAASAGGSGIQADGRCQGTCTGTCRVTAPAASCAGTCDGSCDGTCTGSATLSVLCDGSCDSDYEPLTCTGGELRGGCQVAARCDANCDTSVSAKAQCKPPAIAFAFFGVIDPEAAGKLGRVLEANLGLVFAIGARMEGMSQISILPFGDNIDADALAGVQPECVPRILAAMGGATADVEATGLAYVNVLVAALD